MKTPDPEAPAGVLGILGGTFDPVHKAHLALAQTALDTLGLAHILWIPAGQPPHRTTPDTAPRATPAQRLAMVAAAIAADPRHGLDASEVASAAASYTVPTLERLRARYGPRQPLVLLMGADAFRGLTGWHRWQDICNLAHLAVATRPGFPLTTVDPPLAELLARRRGVGADFCTAPSGIIVPFELVAGTVSATEVRNRIAAGCPAEQLAELLPAPVLDYIHQHSLYRH
jgi:nicotinate-nucleotide adenylyltransferase